MFKRFIPALFAASLYTTMYAAPSQAQSPAGADHPPLVPLRVASVQSTPLHAEKQQRDLTIDDLTCRFDLHYESLGVRHREQAGLAPQAMDVSLQLGLNHKYGLLGGGVSSDSFGDRSSIPSLSVVKNNLHLGAGYEVNRWYRLEGDAIMVRHHEFLPGIEARLVGDLRGANYGFMEDVDLGLGLHIINRLPHVSGSAGMRFSHYHAGVEMKYGDKRFSVEPEFQVQQAWPGVVASAGVKGFYRQDPAGKEQGAFLDLKLRTEGLPRM